jgi:hypothetical protein
MVKTFTLLLSRLWYTGWGLALSLACIALGALAILRAESSREVDYLGHGWVLKHFVPWDAVGLPLFLAGIYAVVDWMRKRSKNHKD